MWCLLWMKAQNVTIYRTISEHPRQTPQAQLSFGGGVVCCFCRSSTPLFCFLQSALNFGFVVGARNTTWSSLQLLICFNKFLVGFWPTLHLNHYEVMKGNETFQFQVLLRLVFFTWAAFSQIVLDSYRISSDESMLNCSLNLYDALNKTIKCSLHFIIQHVRTSISAILLVYLNVMHHIKLHDETRAISIIFSAILRCSYDWS